MDFLRQGIEVIFSIALFINALLFVPQVVHIFKKKTAQGLSLLTFAGFLLIQLAIVLHGIISKDYGLIVGYLCSMLTCGSVVVLILIYGKQDKNDADVLSAQEVLAQLPGHVYWKDKFCVCVGCNENNLRDFGLTALSDFKGKTDYDFFSKKEADELRKADEEIIRTGQPKVVEEGLTKADGTKALYLSHKAPLKNKQGEIVGIIGTSVDIINAKQETSDRLAMLENIIAVMPGNVYWMNREGVYLGCNDNEAKSVGLNSRKDIVGKRNVDLSGFLIPEVLDPINKKVMEEGNAISLEEPAILRDGKKATFISSKVPLYNGRGDVFGMVGISIDITKEKKSQEALSEANRARLEFISTASHEVINHVSCAVILATRLQENLLTLQDILPEKTNKITSISQILTETLEDCKNIRTATEGGMTVIKNLSALHQMQLDGITSKPIFFNIQHLLDISIKKSTYPNTNNITLEKSISPAVPQDLIIDVDNVMHALSIVIGNAFRFSHPEGKIHITVKENEGRWLVICVQDFGVGMYQKQIDNLSKTLLSEKESLFSKPSVQLSRVKMYLEASGGRLEIESARDQGTEVKLHVPYQLSIPAQVGGETIMDPVQQQNREIKNIVMHSVDEPICAVLLVEDDVITQKTAAQILLELGYQVDVAKDGAEAIQMAIAKNYAIALLDITLPDMSGLDVLRQIHASKGEKTIFIALSSHTSEKEEEYFMREGVMALLAKPVKIKQLKAVMDSALEVKAKLDQE